MNIKYFLFLYYLIDIYLIIQNKMMIRERRKGVIRDLTNKYNLLVNEELDKRKSNNNSEGEKIEKINGKR